MPPAYPPVSIEDIDDPRDAPLYTNVSPPDGSLLEGPFDDAHARTYDEFFSSFHKNTDNDQRNQPQNAGK